MAKPKLAASNADVRAWIDGLEQAARRQRELLRDEGADGARAIAISLDMIRLAGTRAADPVRERGVREVRETWAKLRARLGRS